MPFFIKIEKFTKETIDLELEVKRQYLLEHKNWVKKLRKSGENISSGYLVDNQGKPGGGGLLILEAESFEYAQILISQDPMIKNNLVIWNIQEWISVDGKILQFT